MSLFRSSSGLSRKLPIASSSLRASLPQRLLQRTSRRLVSQDATKTGHATPQGRAFLAGVLCTSLAVGVLMYRPQQQKLEAAAMNAPFARPATSGSDSRLVPDTGETTSNPSRNGSVNLQIYDDLEEEGHSLAETDLPVEDAVLTLAPYVPPSIKRDHPALVKVNLSTMTKERQLTSPYKYEQWTFNGSCPGPFIRARAGDVLELTLTNKDESGTPHNIDSHAFIGPGGGAALTTASENESKTARFKLLYPGLYVYHCAAAPVPVHIANGMYGLIYVQPADHDLPEVDREYYVMQSEFYHEPPEIMENGKRSPTVEFSYPSALREEPSVVCFNGSESALTRDAPLKAKLNETVRIFFGNAGPNLTSAFHVIGSNFKSVYRDGDVVNPPANFVATVPVPPGAATITDMKMIVPGTYTLVDHALFRLEKGAAGFLNVSGHPRPDIYQSPEHPAPCVGCKLHA